MALLEPTDIAWLNYIIDTAALLTALGVIWRQGIRPVRRFAHKLSDAVDEFFHLKKTVDRIETKMTLNQSEVMGRIESQDAELASLHEYSHQAIHEIRAGFTRVGMGQEVTADLAKELNKVAERLERLPGRDQPPGLN